MEESEIIYVKKLLRQKNHEYWEEPSNMTDLHRHCKYTIRKLARRMAGLETNATFKRLREADRKNTTELVYRAELMFQAKADAEKIFKFVSKAYYDET
jgi:hypothetical protein